MMSEVDIAHPSSSRAVALMDLSRQLSIMAVVVAVVVLFWPTSHSLVVEWLDTDKRVYTHGPLVFLIGLWLLWRANKVADEVPGHTALPWVQLSLLVAISVVWLIAWRAAIQAVHQALLPLMIWGTLRMAFGPAVARRSLIPVLFFYCSIPIWDAGVPLLRSMTVSAVAIGLRGFGVPVYVSGNLVHIPEGSFEVEDGCSGLHYFIVALTLAVLLGELQRASLRSRFALLCIALVLAVVTNWVRVWTVALAGHLTDMQHYLVRVDHYYFGWVLFGLAMIVFFRLERYVVSGEAAEPRSGSHDVSSASARVPVVRMVLAVVALATGPAYAAVVPLRAAAVANVVLPSSNGTWTRSPDCVLTWEPRFVQADVTQMAEYHASERSVCAFAATYLEQRQDKELIGYFNSVLGAMNASSAEQISVNGLPFEQLTATTAEGSEILVRYHYLIGRRRLVTSLGAQVQYGIDTLYGAAPASIVAIASRCISSCADAAAAMDFFVARATFTAENPAQHGETRQ